jgi:uncharacterized protein YfkK (UPF0435 family)
MLPKIKQPIFTMTIPSSKKLVKYRPFTVAEEKLLMIAKESNEASDIVNVYKQIINNCIIDDVNVDKLAYFDLEYIFLMLRAKSVSNIVDLQVTDEEDKQTYMVKFDLEQIRVSDTKTKDLFELSDGTNIKLKYPSYGDLSKVSSVEGAGSADMLTVIRSCLEQIIVGEEVFELSEYGTAEVDDFILSLGSKDLLKLQEFFENLPKVYADIKYKRKDGTEKTIKLEGMQSFFG